MEGPPGLGATPQGFGGPPPQAPPGFTGIMPAGGMPPGGTGLMMPPGGTGVAGLTGVMNAPGQGGKGGGGGFNLGGDLGFTPPPTGVAFGRRNVRLPPEVNRILYVRNMPYKISADEMYDIFGKYGSLRQIRRGNGPETR